MTPKEAAEILEAAHHDGLPFVAYVDGVRFDHKNWSKAQFLKAAAHLSEIHLRK